VEVIKINATLYTGYYKKTQQANTVQSSREGTILESLAIRDNLSSIFLEKDSIQHCCKSKCLQSLTIFKVGPIFIHEIR
jgi:hypothetical protein